MNDEKKARRRRKFKHEPYYALKAWQALLQISDETMAEELHMTVRTFQDKRTGYYEYTLSEGKIITEKLGRTHDEIFLTNNVTM